MNDVLLINPPMRSPEVHSEFNNLCPPLGLGYLAASLISGGISTKILDLTFSRDIYSDLKDNIVENSNQFVGITTVTQNYSISIQIARLVKEICKSCFIVFGGPHVTYVWKEVLKENIIDAVVLFEGEQTIVDLYKEVKNSHNDLKSIKGIAFRSNGSSVITEPCLPQRNLDLIPYPSRSLLPMAQYRRPGTIMTSRGCPKKCIFCISGTFEGQYRARSSEDVFGELEIMYNNWGIKEFYFIDNVFTVDRKRVDAICDMIRKNLRNISFICVSRADLISQDLVDSLKSGGCSRIEIGVESGVQANIDSMGKSITIEQVKKAAQIVLGRGLLPMFTFQIGSPYDDVGSIQQTLELAAYLRSKGAATLFSIMTPFPGTPISEKAEEYGIRIHTKEWSEYRTSNPIYDTPHATRNDFRRALYHENLNQFREKEFT